jgi:hypothetical protein
MRCDFNSAQSGDQLRDFRTQQPRSITNPVELPSLPL